MRFPSLGRVVLLSALAFSVACGGDEEPRTPLAPPPVSPSLIAHGQGTIGLNVAARATQGIDPTALARDAGATTACGKLIILISWRTDDRQALLFTSRVQQQDVKVGEGDEGVASVSGCGLISATNEGGGTVSGELRYVVAEMR